MSRIPPAERPERPRPRHVELLDELDASQIEALVNAMEEAFPSRSTLEIAVRPLWKNLGIFIGPNSPLEEVFPTVIQRATSEGMIPLLLRALRRNRPGAPELYAFTQTLLPQAIEQVDVNELAELLMKLPSSQERLQAKVKSGVVGDLLGAESFRSSHDLLERLAEVLPIQGELHPLIALAWSFARDIEGLPGADEREVAQKIKRWCESICRNTDPGFLDVEERRIVGNDSGTGLRYLVIRLQEQGASYMMKAWAMGHGLDNPENLETRDVRIATPGSSPRRTRDKQKLPDNVRKALEDFVDDVLKHSLFSDERYVHIEFVMAPRHFGLAVDALEIKVGNMRRAIGHRYTVFVRPDCRDRRCANNLKHRWGKVTQWIAEKKGQSTTLGEGERPQHVVARLARGEIGRVFQDWNHRFCLVLTQPPTRIWELGEQLRDAGVPIALWPRHNTPGIRSLEQLATDPPVLPGKVLLERQDGQELTLFWDDFSRQPPDAGDLTPTTPLSSKE